MKAKTNIDWAAKQIINNFTNEQFMQLQACFAKLDEVLFKSWSKEMSFADLKEAVDMVSELSDFLSGSRFTIKP